MSDDTNRPWDPHWLLRDPELLEAVKRRAAEYVPSFRLDDILAHNQDPVVDQLAFRWATPGTEAGHGWEAAENVALTLETDGQGNYPIFLRIELEESTTNADQNLARTYKLQYRHQPSGSAFGSWTDVTASSTHIQTLADSNIVDGAATTDRLTTSADAFQAGEYDEADGTFDSVSWVAARASSEFLSSLQIIDSAMGAGDVLECRIVESSGTLLQAYTRTPSLTWDAGVVAGTPDALTGGSTLATPTGAVNHVGTPAELTGASALETPGGTTNTVGTPAGLTVGSTLAQPTGALTWSGIPAALAVACALAIPTGSVSTGAVVGTPDALTVASTIEAPTGVLGDPSTRVRLVDSTFVPDGGVATTARLSVPPGKVGGDFQAGRLQDDHTEAPAPSVTGEKYTELEWVLELVDGVALPDEVQEFALMRDDGSIVTLGVAPTLQVDSGATVGTPADLAVASTLEAPAGTVNHVGTPQALTVASALDPPSGVPTTPGTPADLAVAAVMDAAGGAVLHVGTPAELVVAASLDVPSGASGLSGTPDALAVGSTIEAPGGAVVHVGNADELTVAAALELPGGAVNHVGTPAALTVGCTLDTATGVSGLTSTPADLTVAASIEAPSGSVSVAGTPVDLVAGSSLDVPVGSVNRVGTPAGLSVASTLDAPAGAADHVGTPAELVVGSTLDTPAGQTELYLFGRGLATLERDTHRAALELDTHGATLERDTHRATLDEDQHGAALASFGRDATLNP